MQQSFLIAGIAAVLFTFTETTFTVIVSWVLLKTLASPLMARSLFVVDVVLKVCYGSS